MSQVTGRIFVKINGKMQRSKSGAKFNPGGVERTPVVGDDSVHGYAEKIVPAEVECTISHLAGTNLIELRNLVNATIEVETDTGDRYIIRKAFVAEMPALTGGEGEVALKFNGPPADRAI